MARLPKIKTLRKKLTKLSREYVFDRDKNKCVKCGSTKNLQLSHVIPKSRSLYLRWNSFNLKVLCAGCHLKWHKDPLDAGVWFKNKYPSRANYIDNNRETSLKEHRSTMGVTEREWLNEQIDYYKKRLNG